jgi:UDP-glucose 4-epimerase
VRLLVVGHGLLGKAVLRCAAAHDIHPVEPIAWEEPAQARRQLDDLATSFGESIDGPWRLAWCAGAGVVGTSDAQFADEQSYLETFLHALGSLGPAKLTDGAVFFASSAGGVYGAGSSGWISEATSESPVSAYGESKLAQERMIAEWSAATGVPALIGRISNLYGPGQNLAKPQGFISQLLRSMLAKQPFQLRASGDTERDFLHVDDAAARICAWLDMAGETGVTCKLITAGRSHTLPRVANVARSVTRIQPKVVYAAKVGTAAQPHHLRFATNIRPDIDAAAPSRPLEVGVRQTWQAMLQDFADGAYCDRGSIK